MAEAPPGSLGSVPRLVALIPAAGRSRRMGRPKPLLPLGDTDFIGTLVAALGDPALGVGRIVVVHRADDGALAARLKALGAEQGSDGPELLPVTVPPASGDMLASVRAGWAAARRGVTAGPGASSRPVERSGALVWPVDAPLVAQATVRAVVAEARRDPARAARPVYAGAPGHPLWAPAALLDAVAPAGAGPGLRGLMEAIAIPVHDVAVPDPDCLVNLNTPEAYAARRGGPA